MLRRQDAACGHSPMYVPHNKIVPYIESRESIAMKSSMAANATASSGCCSFGMPSSQSAEVDTEVEDHNRQVANLLSALGATGSSGRRGVINAVAELQGIDNDDELEALYRGDAIGKLRVPNDLRSTMQDIGLGSLLAPVN